jgi:hypothetical protein
LIRWLWRITLRQEVSKTLANCFRLVWLNSPKVLHKMPDE